MSEIVFILGAGASKHAGVPLMNEFLRKARSLARFIPYELEFDSVFKAIGKLQSVHSKARLDIYNIESVFAAFEMAHTLRQLGDFKEEQLRDLIDSTKNLIAKTIQESLTLGTVPYQKFFVLLAQLVELRRSFALLTFNYDLALDYLLSQAKKFSPDYFVDDLKDARASSAKIPLLKLHGSLNWGYCENDAKIIVRSMDECIKYDVKRDDGKRKPPKLATIYPPMFHCGTDVSFPFIVPPTWNKGHFHELLSSVWAQAATELKEASTIIVIGYSLPPTDVFFKFLYALGTVSDNPIDRFVVINKDQEGGVVERRFRNLLGLAARDRFAYIPEPFEESIGTLREILGVNPPKSQDPYLPG